MKVYSPSQTKSYFESPIGWYLHYVDKWSPKVLGRKELSGFLGISFARGVEVWHKFNSPYEEVLNESRKCLNTLLSEAYDSGQRVSPKEDAFLETILTHLERALAKVMVHPPIPKEWTVLESEYVIPEAGNCRLDLLVDTPQGITFADYKTKVSIEGYAKDRAIMDWSQDWQFYHYTWALKTFEQREINSFSVALVVCSGATKPTLHTFPLDPELLTMWESCAKQTWRNMLDCEIGKAIPVWNFQMSNRFGADPWVDAIVYNKLDEGLMTRNYVKKVI